MNTKILVSLIYVTLLSIIIGLIGLALNLSQLDIFLQLGEPIFVVLGICLLVSTGTFINTKEYRIAKACISLVIIGALFKILHLTGADEFIGLGFLSFVVLYVVYMVRHRKLRWTNFLKLFFLISIFTEKYLRIRHEAYSDLFAIAGEIALAILVFEFIKNDKAYSN